MNRNPSYALSSWLFRRALSLIFVVAFISLGHQVRGLWGEHGVLPIGEYLTFLRTLGGAEGFFQGPSLFWISSRDFVLVGCAWTGVIAGALAFFGWAEGWMLLICTLLYLSFGNTGQAFLGYQWDRLLPEAGFLALFACHWQIRNRFRDAFEPHGAVRALFYLLLFKLMFLSGVVKFFGHDPAWLDFTALSYHYLTAPLPNPLSPFFSALPAGFHRFSTWMTWVIELPVPLLLAWPRARVVAGVAFILLNLMILFTANFTFFNYLTIALCIWTIPDRLWRRLFERMRLGIRLNFELAPSRNSRTLLSVALILALLDVFWLGRGVFPGWHPPRWLSLASVSKNIGISNPYGLFPTIYKSRHETVLEGSLDGDHWKEYVFRFVPGPLDRAPPVVAPFMPRLDWELADDDETIWDQHSGAYRPGTWVDRLMMRLLEGRPEVLAFLSNNPFPDTPPLYLRACRYLYEFDSPSVILSTGQWWRRTRLPEVSATLSL